MSIDFNKAHDLLNIMDLSRQWPVQLDWLHNAAMDELQKLKEAVQKPEEPPQSAPSKPGPITRRFGDD